jgi:hypothetical protein
MPVSKRIPIILISLALMIAMLPDVFNTPSLSFASLILGEYKYIYSECLTLLGLLLFLGKKKGFSSV